VAAAIVIGIEPGWTERVVQGIAATGKPVCGFSIERNGDLNTIATASRKAKEFLHGEWIYKIAPDLVEPLKRSFSLK
jgi:(2R)-sulfolactate sulfo-lyase subunit beta